MFDLLFSVALDALEQGLQTELVLLPQFLHLSDQCDLQVLLHHLCFVLLTLADHILDSIGLVVVLDREEDLFLLAHLDEVLRIALLNQERLCHLLLIEDQLLLLLHLQLLNQFKSSGLVVSHVLVPRPRKLLELKLLGTFNVHQFLLLGQSHVLLLALLLSPRELFKPQLHHLCLRVVSSGLCIDAQLVHYSDKDDKNTSISMSMRMRMSKGCKELAI